MLIYVESKAFPHRTFVLLLNALDTVARAKAHMLHILYELGKSEHQFRFRFKGVYLRDAYTFEDYKILDSSVIKMVPMAKSRREVFQDSNMSTVREYSDIGADVAKASEKERKNMKDDVQIALLKEVRLFDRRESMMNVFMVLLWMHFVASLLSFSTVYWYAASWTGVIVIYGFMYCPTYTRVSGFVGMTDISKEVYLISLFLGMLLNLIASVTMGTFLVQDAINHGCAEFKGDCAHVNIWSVMLYFGHSLVLLSTMVLIVIMFRNFKVQVGDIIEYCLVQNKDIAKVVNVAKLGRLKERRNAAFELASLAASGYEAKFKIIGQDGLAVLMSLALCEDETTQEYATEALAELLTVTEIQTQFLELGGARTLCALLHSKSERLMNEAVMAISYIVADSDSNKHAIVGEDGLSDLALAAKSANLHAGQIISGIYLELSFSPEIRSTLAADSSSASALMHLCMSRDDETKRLALQTMELLALENANFIVGLESFLDYLVAIPKTSIDDQLCLLAGKLLLYFAEGAQTCRALVSQSTLKDSLLQLAYNPDPVLQNVVAKIILAVLSHPGTRQDAPFADVTEVLAYLHDNCMDRETWEMAEQGIDILHGYTVKRVDKERSSLTGGTASGSSGTGSSVSLRKTAGS